MKNIGPCKILRIFFVNAYEIEMSEDMGISPIFNVADLYPCRMDGTGEIYDQYEFHWMKQMPTI